MCLLLSWFRGEGVWKGVSGISSAYPLTSVDTSMLFGIGSNTKAFVSTTILSPGG